MTAHTELLIECAIHGVYLHSDGDGGLMIDAPQGALTSDLVDRLKASKTELLAALKSSTASPPSVATPTTEQPEPPLPATEASDDSWPHAAADFALLLTVDDLPVRFHLRQSVEVTHPSRFLAWLRRNIPRGSSGPYATGNTIQADLVCLRDFLTQAG